MKLNYKYIYKNFEARVINSKLKALFLF